MRSLALLAFLAAAHGAAVSPQIQKARVKGNVGNKVKADVDLRNRIDIEVPSEVTEVAQAVRSELEKYIQVIDAYIQPPIGTAQALAQTAKNEIERVKNSVSVGPGNTISVDLSAFGVPQDTIDQLVGVKDSAEYVTNYVSQLIRDFASKRFT